jgi:hypothetical protein
MIDKLELRVPKEIPMSTTFLAAHTRLRAPRSSAYYNIINAPELSVTILDNCIHHPPSSPQQHYKLIFTDIYRLAAPDLTAGIRTAFEIDDADVRDLKVMRVDLTVDVRNVPVQWFLQNSHVKYKRADREYGNYEHSNVLKLDGDSYPGVQTLAHGAHPDRYIIYDKIAQLETEIKRRSHIQEEIVSYGGSPMYKSRVPKELLPYTRRPVLTRVEHQCSGRSVPEKLKTLGELIQNAASLKDPFKSLVLTSASPVPLNEDNWKDHKWLMTYGLAALVQKYGETIVRKRIHNANRVFRKYGCLLSLQPIGITEDDLRRLYQASTSIQLNRLDPPFQGAVWMTVRGEGIWMGGL